MRKLAFVACDKLCHRIGYVVQLHHWMASIEFAPSIYLGQLISVLITYAQKPPLTFFILDTSERVLWQTLKTQMKCYIR